MSKNRIKKVNGFGIPMSSANPMFQQSSCISSSITGEPRVSSIDCRRVPRRTRIAISSSTWGETKWMWLKKIMRETRMVIKRMLIEIMRIMIVRNRNILIQSKTLQRNIKAMLKIWDRNRNQVSLITILRRKVFISSRLNTITSFPSLKLPKIVWFIKSLNLLVNPNRCNGVKM